MKNTQYDKYTQIFKENHGILKLSKAIKLGIPKHYLYKMYSKGIVIKEEKGIYRLSDSDPLSYPDFVQVSLLIPKSIICMISALYFHGLTTQIPNEVHISLPNNVQKPRIQFPPLEIYQVSMKPYTAGVHEYSLDGVMVRIYNPEKTIADCFKFRNRIGLSIAIEALKDYMKQPQPRIDDILMYARIDRVENNIEPYIRALLS